MTKEVIILCIPAKAEYLVTARLVAGAIFGQAGYNMDDIGDAKTALSEACLLLMPKEEEDALLKLEIWVEDGVHMVVSTDKTAMHGKDTAEHEFSMFLLEALIDTIQYTCENGVSAYRLFKAMP